MHRTASILLSLSLVYAPALARTPVPMPAPPAAESLLVSASRRMTSDDPAQRRFALDELDRAVAMAPRDPRVMLMAGRAHLDAGEYTRARECFRRGSELTPDDPRPLVGLAEAARRDWLVVMDSTRFVEALEALRTAAERSPGVAEPWFRLAPLEYEHGDLRRAGLAAERAFALQPDDAQAELACAYLHFRAGRLALADSLFEDALPRLSPAFRKRLGDLSPLLSEEDVDRWSLMTPAERDTFAMRFWRANDPDPTTAVNEARLEFRSRVAHVLLLFSKGASVSWDMRAELYARYGAPAEVASVDSRDLTSSMGGMTHSQDGIGPRGIPAGVPTRSLRWSRPDLGITQLLTEPGIGTRFATRNDDPDARLGEVAMRRNDLLPAGGGRAVFSTLPPGATPLDVAGSVHRFPGERLTRLFAFVTAPGAPADTLDADCVVLDSDDRPVARASRRLGPSACDPTHVRTGEFGFDLPAGEYRVALAVSDGRGGRGTLRRAEHLESRDPGALEVSDVVVVCRPPAAAPTSGTVVLDPDPRALPPPGVPLSVYFEIRGLARDGDAPSHFEIRYTATPLSERRRPSWIQRTLGARERHFLNARSEDTFAGDVRRQFISLPLRDLPAGEYRLDVHVRDLGNGAEQTRSVRFEKTWS